MVHKLEQNVRRNETTNVANQNERNEDLNCNSEDNNTAQQNKKPSAGEKRAEWDKGVEFVLSCIAMSVGLGNIWRFPFTAYQNGGGAFLIPYIIVLIIIGRPIYYLEMCLGQFSSRNNVNMFHKLAPALKGIGYGQCLGSICVGSYYASLIAIILFYFLQSFTSKLPWSYCRDEWLNEITSKNITCIPSTGNQLASDGHMVSSSELYFRKEVLREKSQIDDGLGYPDWRLSLCLAFSYLVLFLITRNGIRSSGKAAYFLAIFPYVIMLCLLGRSVTLEGASNGMLYFIKPTWSKLLEAKVWYNAVTQCFFSLNIGFGTVIMFASYNKFKQNIYRDCLIVNILDTFTSLLSGTAIFGILGHLAFKLNVDVGDVINTGGTGLAFISYPEAIAKFDAIPWLFAVLFFFMLFVLGIGSMVALQGVPLTILLDSVPKCKPWMGSLGITVSFFCFSLLYITNGGQFIFTMVDYFGGTMIFLVLCIFETITVFWWYGLENFCEDIEFMLNRKIGIYWRLNWGVINPIILTTIFLYFILTMERLQHENKDFPDIALVFGWIIIAVGVLQIPLWWLYYVYHLRRNGIIEGMKRSLSHARWGPNNADRLTEWTTLKRNFQERKSAVKLNWLLLPPQHIGLHSQTVFGLKSEMVSSEVESCLHTVAFQSISAMRLF
ncbi:hypothetical protein Trydic_g9186 [Trypoxylus dichotomus]